MIEKRREEEKPGKNLIEALLLLLPVIFFGCGSKMPPPGKPDIDPPEIEITYPQAMDTIKGSIYVKFSYKDKSPLQWIRLYVDGVRSASDSSFSDSLLFKSDTLYDGVHKLMLEAKDKWDNLGKSEIVTVVTVNGNKKEEKDEGVDGEYKRTKEKSR